MILRRVTEEDAALLWEWANDLAVREASFRGEPIEWESHTAWLSEKLADPRCHMYLALDERGEPVAQVRFDVGVDREAVISISVAPSARGKGHGSAALQLACERISCEAGVGELIGYVKRENTPSLRMFERGGFERRGSTRIDGMPAVVMTRTPKRPGAACDGRAV